MKKNTISLLAAIVIVIIAITAGCRVRLLPESEPVSNPVLAPKDSPSPTPEPSLAPTPEPSTEPTPKPNPDPTAEPTSDPTSDPTPLPAASPPTEAPSLIIEKSAPEDSAINDNPADGESVQVPDEEDGKTRPSDSGGAIGAIVDKYSGVLSEGLGSLYECQVPYIYLELPEDYVTVNRHSELHQLILDSGGYNIAEKLLDDALTVEASWVRRKNPEVIVKFISGADSAAEKYDEIMRRDGWESVSAVINRRIILISSELLESPYGIFAAKLYIARALYPDLFGDIDIAAICRDMLGTDTVFAYTGTNKI